MKKLVSILLLAVLALSLVSCSDPYAKSEGVMTHDEYIAAADDTDVVLEVFVQATQSWWDNKITVYAADPDGAYFIYNMTCSEEDAKKLTKGTMIKVTGSKITWEGEVEVAEGATFEFAGDLKYEAEAKDLTSLLGTDDLINHQNELAIFKGMTVVSIEYKNGVPGDDIYLKLSKDGKEYDFCVEKYLTFPDSEVYKAVGALKAGDVVDIEGFLYWYGAPNTHITAVTKK